MVGGPLRTLLVPGRVVLYLEHQERGDETRPLFSPRGLRGERGRGGAEDAGGRARQKRGGEVRAEPLLRR